MAGHSRTKFQCVDGKDANPKTGLFVKFRHSFGSLWGQWQLPDREKSGMRVELLISLPASLDLIQDSPPSHDLRLFYHAP